MKVTHTNLWNKMKSEMKLEMKENLAKIFRPRISLPIVSKTVEK